MASKTAKVPSPLSYEEVLQEIRPINYDFGGVEVPCVTITQLAKLAGKRPATLRKLEQREIFPSANFRSPEKTFPSGYVRAGQRLYSLDLAKKVALILRTEFSQGIPVTAEAKQRLQIVFQEERQTLFG